MSSKKGRLTKDVKIKLQEQGFKSIKEFNKAKSLFSKTQKGDLKAGKELDKLEKKRKYWEKILWLGNCPVWTKSRSFSLKKAVNFQDMNFQKEPLANLPLMSVSLD